MRIISLDVLRALSILAVVFYHYAGFAWGLYGVALFFIISGYCIPLSADSSSSPWHFYAKRLGRLLPALVVCGFVTVLLKQSVPFLPDRAVEWSDYLYTLVALPTLNLLQVDYQFPDGAYWSLVVEFKFYFLVFCLLYLGKERLAITATIASVIMTLVNLWVGYFDFVPYLPYFLAGIGFKVIYEEKQIKTGFGIVATAVMIALLCLLFNITDPSIPTNAQSFIAFLVCVGIFISLINIKKLPYVKPIAWIGIVSYPLYLLHQDIGYWLLVGYKNLLGIDPGPIIRSAIIPIIMVGAASAVYLLTEKGSIKPITRALNKPRWVALAAPAVFLLFFFGWRFYETGNVQSTMASLESDIPKSAWGDILINDTGEFKYIDLHGVPSPSCAQVIRDASQLPGVERVAVTTLAADERPTPLTWVESEAICLGIKRRVVRVITRQ